MSKESTTAAGGGGIGFVGLLTIVFITLKLIGVSQVATWSWWWVLSPIWISWGLALVFLLIALIILAIVYALS